MINVITIDDSPEDLKLINSLLDDTEVNILQSFNNPKDAKEFLEENHVDLIFTDIEMDESNGFDFVESLKVKPMIVFVSTFPRYAAKAFKFEPLHYIVKPANDVEVITSIERCKNRLSGDNTVDNYIVLKIKHSDFIKVFYEEILFLESDGDYVITYTKTNTIRSLTTLKSLEEKLPNRFIKVHRSYIINKSQIISFDGKYLKVQDYTIPISRAYKKSVSLLFSNL